MSGLEAEPLEYAVSNHSVEELTEVAVACRALVRQTALEGCLELRLGDGAAAIGLLDLP